MSLKLLYTSLRRGTFTSGFIRRLSAINHKEKIRVELEHSLKKPRQEALRSADSVFRRYFSGSLFKKGLPPGYRKLLANYIVKKKQGEPVSLDEHETVITKTNQLDPGLLKSEYWKKLSFILFSNGFFVLAYIARKKALISAYREAELFYAGYKAKFNAFNAAFDQGDLIHLDKYYYHLAKKLKAEHMRPFDFLYLMKRNDTKKAKTVARELFNNLDFNYESYLSGKSVALVGPAPTDEEVASEIDGFDIVIRINYGGNDKLPDQNEFGKKVDVSYYNNECAANINELSDISIFNKITYAAFKTINYEYQERLIDKRKGRCFFDPLHLFFSGGSNMVPNVLYDLLHFETARIKLFKVNFYLSKKTYYDGYRIAAKTDQSKARAWYLFALHDPISQLNFVRNLWHNNLIEVDKSCEAVLSLNNDQYIKQLEILYDDNN